MTEQRRWRVDCRKQRGEWRTVQSESYDDVCAALKAVAMACRQDWDTVTLVRLRPQPGSARRLLVCGGRMLAPCARPQETC